VKAVERAGGQTGGGEKGVESLAAVRSGLSSALDDWMKQQGDQGHATEMKAFERMGRGKKK
jgi:hypothetical protein